MLSIPDDFLMDSYKKAIALKSLSTVHHSFGKRDQDDVPCIPQNKKQNLRNSKNESPSIH